MTKKTILIWAKKPKVRITVKLNIDYIVNDDNTYSYIVKSLETNVPVSTNIVYNINFEDINKQIVMLAFETIALVDITTISEHNPDELIYNIESDTDNIIEHNSNDDNINEIKFLTKEEAENLYVYKDELNNLKAITWGTLDDITYGIASDEEFTDIFITKEEIYNTYLTKEEFEYFLENNTGVTWGIISNNLSNNLTKTISIDYSEFITKNDAEEIFISKEDFNEAIKSINNGVTWGVIGTIIPDITTTIRLNQTISDPYSMLSGEFGKDGDPKTNVISWIRANSHRYVGNYDAEQGMVLRQLNDNDSTKYADGSDASEDIKGTNGGDVFMKMPDFWFKGVEVDGNANIVDMLFSAKEPTDEGWTKWDGNTLIGAYEVVAENINDNTTGKLFSRSGTTTTVKISQNSFMFKARNRSNGDDHFQIVTYEAHQVMALLYMAWYGNTNGTAQCGSGTSDYPKVTGQTNVDGMNDTVKEKSRSINFWGLENWWGDVSEWVDNIKLYNTSGGVNVLDYDGGVERQVQVPTSSGGSIRKMLLREKLDTIPTSISGTSYTTYYCDRGYIFNTTGYVVCRSGPSSYATGGPFFFTIDTIASYSSGEMGSRLLYHGRVTIAKNSTRMMRSLAPVWKPIDLQYVYRNGNPTLRTGFDFNICNVDTLEEVGKLSLYGLNINYEEIEFESNALSSDKDGNLTFNTDALPQSVDMNYKGQLIGTLKFYDISEEELIESQRVAIEREMNEQSESVKN